MEKNYSYWLGFYGFGALPDHHHIIEPIMGTYAAIHVPYDILGVNELFQNGGHSANTIAELLWHE